MHEGGLGLGWRKQIWIGQAELLPPGGAGNKIN